MIRYYVSFAESLEINFIRVRILSDISNLFRDVYSKYRGENERMGILSRDLKPYKFDI